MRLLVYLLFFLVVANVEARVVIRYWEGTEPSLDKKQEVQRLMNEIAAEWVKPEYAERGPLDFLNTSEEFEIHFTASDEDEPAKMFCVKLFFHYSLLNDMQKLRRMAFHEFSHLYDFVIVDKCSSGKIRQFIVERKTNKNITSSSYSSIKRTPRSYLQESETRAREKEKRYLFKKVYP